MTLIHDLVEVTAGFALSKEATAPGDCRLLQVASFGDEGQLLPGAPVVSVAVEQVPAQHQLRAGDVLLTAKGARLVAACVEAAWLPAAAATTLLVLRLRTAACLPEFLALWLNQPATRAALQRRLSATTVPTLNKRDLLEVVLPGNLPSLANQQRLLRLQQLRLEEKEVTMRLLHVREAEFFVRFTTLTTPATNQGAETPVK